MSVVLRCPTCGTTQEDAGECEACSEGEVRYFCTNHPGGVWLDGPVCGSCGAKFGDPPNKPQPTPSVPTRPAGAPDFRSPSRRRAAETSSKPDFSKRPPRRAEPEEPEPAEPEVLPRTPSLGELLEEIIEERARGRTRYEVEGAPWAMRPPRRPGFPLAGCLVRIVGLVFLLIAAAIIFLFFLFGGFIIN